MGDHFQFQKPTLHLTGQLSRKLQKSKHGVPWVPEAGSSPGLDEAGHTDSVKLKLQADGRLRSGRGLALAFGEEMYLGVFSL